MPLPTIERIDCARCHVRAVRDTDLPALMQVNGDPEVTRFLPYAPWRDLDDAHAWLARMRTLEAAGGTRQLVIALADDDAIGTVLLFRHDESSARAELGYVLGRAHWGRGLAHEALRGVVRHAFAQLALRRLEAEVDPRNEPSWRLLERLGFVREGLARDRWLNHGLPCSVYDYGLLQRDLGDRP